MNWHSINGTSDSVVTSDKSYGRHRKTSWNHLIFAIEELFLAFLWQWSRGNKETRPEVKFKKMKRLQRRQALDLKDLGTISDDSWGHCTQGKYLNTEDTEQGPVILPKSALFRCLCYHFHNETRYFLSPSETMVNIWVQNKICLSYSGELPAKSFHFFALSCKPDLDSRGHKEITIMKTFGH